MKFSTILIAVAIFCTLAVVISSSFAQAKVVMEEEEVPILTEAQVKKLKMKELKVFLADRGVKCDACSEKGDFVKKAVANRETPLLPSKRKMKVKGEFWEFWAAMSKQSCEEGLAKKKSDNTKLCDDLSVSIDHFFMQHGKRTANKLKKKPAAMLKTSVGEPYMGAGKRMLAKLVSHCLKNSAQCGSQSKLSTVIEEHKIKGVDFAKWITNVGIENTNPMYEALKDVKLIADL